MDHRDLDLRIIESGNLVALNGPYLPDVYLNTHMMPIRVHDR